MICDKCGFEHNNRSACPKCGARAIYVNEDYARRRQEWEEAQKKGTAGVIPPGIMHSTKEEHDIRTGKDRVTHIKQEGGSEMTGLSFGIIKDKFIKLVAKIVVFFQKKKKKRGANNPVVRKLEFSDKPDTLDNSKLVLSHKVFRDKRKPVFIGGIVVLLLAVGIPVTIHNIKRIDHSRVLIFDGQYGYYSDSPSKKLFGAEGGAVVTAISDKAFYETDAAGITLFKDGKIKKIEAVNPKVFATNENLSAAIYESEGKLYFYNKEAVLLNCESSEVSEGGCQISDNGNYYIITVLHENGDDSTYTMYYGDDQGIKEVSEDDLQKVVVDVLDDGSVMYLDMDNAKYGIVNDRAIKIFDGTNSRKVVDNVVEYKYVDSKNLLYYIDSEDKMYVYDNSKLTYIDNEVQSFCENAFDENGVYYLKDGGCYEVSIGKDYTTPMFKLNQYEITLYWEKDDKYAYYADSTGLYYINSMDGQQSGTKVADINYGDAPILVDGELLLIDAAGDLTKYGILQTKIAKNADNLMVIDNYAGYSFTKGDTRYIYDLKDKEKASFKMGTAAKLIYSKKNFYCLGSDNSLLQISKNGKKTKILGLSYNIFVI